MKTMKTAMKTSAALLSLTLCAAVHAAETETALDSAASAFEALGSIQKGSFEPSAHMDPPPGVQPAPYARNGWSEASRVCERMLSGVAHSCRRTVERARFFTLEAVEACDSMALDGDKAECLSAIADHPIPPQAAWECSRSFSSTDKLDCLSRTARLNPPQGGWAQDPWGPGPGYDPRGMGLEEAAAVCRSLNYDSSKTECVRIIGRARMFSPEAARVCAGLDYDSSKTNCLEAIKDKFISPQTASLCAEMTYDSSKVQCLRDGASREPEWRNGPWGPGSGHDRRGMDAAAQACRKLNYDSNRTECVRVIGSARFFSTEAAQVCGDLNYDSSVLSCLKSVKDRDIAPHLARICGEMDYDSQTISCLNNAGAR